MDTPTNMTIIINRLAYCFSKLMKAFVSFLIIPLFCFGQILNSDIFPFQNMSKDTHNQKVYDLILDQELLEDIELDDYINDHKTVAILPVNLIYQNLTSTSSAEDLRKIELLISKCIYTDFVAGFNYYSKSFLRLENTIENKKIDLQEYVPQTQINKYLADKKNTQTVKKNIILQDLNETGQKLNTLTKSDVYEYPPEALCGLLGVDAIIYIHINSDIFIPIKNCLSPHLLVNIDMFGADFFYQFLTDKKNIYLDFQEAKKLQFHNKQINTFCSIYDRSGKLLWLYGKKTSGMDILKNIPNDNQKSSNYSVGLLFSQIFDNFPYLLK